MSCFLFPIVLYHWKISFYIGRVFKHGPLFIFKFSSHGRLFKQALNQDRAVKRAYTVIILTSHFFLSFSRYQSPRVSLRNQDKRPSSMMRSAVCFTWSRDILLKQKNLREHIGAQCRKSRKVPNFTIFIYQQQSFFYPGLLGSIYLCWFTLAYLFVLAYSKVFVWAGLLESIYLGWLTLAYLFELAYSGVFIWAGLLWRIYLSWLTLEYLFDRKCVIWGKNNIEKTPRIGKDTCSCFVLTIKLNYFKFCFWGVYER